MSVSIKINKGFKKLFSHQKALLTALLLGVLFFCLNCEEHFLGYGPQPCYFEETEFEPLLNILGILRPGSTDSLSLSFVYVEQSLPATSSDEEDTLDVSDADVTLYSTNEFGSTDSLKMIYTDPDTVFSTYTYRSNDFNPEASKVYGLSCRREDYPELTAETVVPQVPQILDGSVQSTEDSFSFTIIRDELAVVYDVSVQLGDRKYDQRVRRPESDDISISFRINTTDGNTAAITVTAYDQNLSEYLAYNVGIKPNTYRADYSTVENGYGCFGSINILIANVEL